MELSNFKLEKTEGEDATNWRYFSSVDVTTGFWFWKKTARRGICRNFIGSYFFTDTGEYVPSDDVEKLARV